MVGQNTLPTGFPPIPRDWGADLGGGWAKISGATWISRSWGHLPLGYRFTVVPLRQDVLSMVLEFLLGLLVGGHGYTLIPGLSAATPRKWHPRVRIARSDEASEWVIPDPGAPWARVRPSMNFWIGPSFCSMTWVRSGPT
jgi:hypothetical protein